MVKGGSLSRRMNMVPRSKHSSKERRSLLRTRLNLSATLSCRKRRTLMRQKKSMNSNVLKFLKETMNLKVNWIKERTS